MPKIPRDISGRELAKLLKRYQYKIVRQTGSHIRLVSTYEQIEYRITIPDHQPTKIGTLKLHEKIRKMIISIRRALHNSDFLHAHL